MEKTESKNAKDPLENDGQICDWSRLSKGLMRSGLPEIGSETLREGKRDRDRLNHLILSCPKGTNPLVIAEVSIKMSLVRFIVGKA